MEANFKYNIGDYVANAAFVKEMVMTLQHTDMRVRINHLQVEGRMMIEDKNGVLLFYVCRTMTGVIEKHPEEFLVKGTEFWDTWIDASIAQEKRLSRKGGGGNETTGSNT